MTDQTRNSADVTDIVGKPKDEKGRKQLQKEVAELCDWVKSFKEDAK